MTPEAAATLIVDELSRRGYRLDQENHTIEGFPIWFEITPYGDDRLRGKVTGGRAEWDTIQNKNAEREATNPFHQTMVRHIKIEVDELLKVGVEGVRELSQLMETLGLYSGNPLRLLELFQDRGFDPRRGLLIPHFALEMGRKTCAECGHKKEWYFKLDQPAHYLLKLGLLNRIYCKVCMPVVKPRIENQLASLGDTYV